MPTGLLPACAAALLTVLSRGTQPKRGWLDAAMTAAVGVAVFMVVSTECLSPFGLIGFGPLVVLWAFANLGLAYAVYRTGAASVVATDLRRRFAAWRWSPWAIGVTAMAAATLLIALLAPPNTWDSMTYHLARVAHWHRNGSLAHYPTNIVRQLHLGPGAEILILQLQTLAGGDRFANCVQWSAYGLSTVAAMLTARELGAGRAGERFAAVFVLTVPMLILQSTSTQNDLVTAVWVAAFTLYGVRWIRRGTPTELWRAACALGLAVLTKGTALFFAGPFVVWFAAATLRRHRARSWRAALVVVAVVGVLNGGHFARNSQVYGHPLGSGVEGPGAYASEIKTPATFLSGVTRNLALQLATPFEAWNQRVASWARQAHWALDLDPSDPRSTWQGFRFDVYRSSRHEDSEGAPLQVLLVGAALAAAAIVRRLRPAGSAWSVYCLSTLAGAALFAFLLRWQPWHTRLHAPLWVLAAPCLAVVVGRIRWRPAPTVISITLALWAVPLVLHGSPRPLVGDRSVITTPRAVQYFANRPDLRAQYEAIARRVRESGTHDLGLRLAGNDWEYPLWIVLGPDVDLQHVGVENESARLAAGHRPEPEAIICTDTEARAALDDDPNWSRTVTGASAALYERQPEDRTPRGAQRLQ